MATKKPPRPGAKAGQRSGQATVSLMEGLSITALARLFRIDKKEASLRMAGVTPCGERMGYPVYQISDAAQKLTAPSDDQVIRLIENMPANKLPMKIRKEFWDAALSRQKYEEKAGNLWRTEDVQEVFIEVFKTIRTTMNLFADKVDREVSLTNDQRALIISMSDDLLAEVSKALTDRDDFKNYKNSLLKGEDGSDELTIYDMESMKVNEHAI